MQHSFLRSGIWHQMVIRGHPAQIQRVREDVEGALVVYPFSDREIFSVLLALEEALANPIKHGNRMDRHKKVTIRYRVSSKRFDIQIVDEGGGFQPDEVPILSEPLRIPTSCDHSSCLWCLAWLP